MSTKDDCPSCGVSPEDINKLTGEIDRLRAALEQIARLDGGPGGLAGHQANVARNALSDGPNCAHETSERLTRDDELFIATRLMARARHQSKKLLNAEGKTLHPGLLADMRADIERCTRLALVLQQPPTE